MWYLTVSVVPNNPESPPECWIETLSLGDKDLERRERMRAYCPKPAGATVEVWLATDNVVEAEKLSIDILEKKGWKVIAVEDRFQIQDDELKELTPQEFERWKLAQVNLFHFQFHPYEMYNHTQLPF